MHPYPILGEVVRRDTVKDSVLTACIPGWVITEARCPDLDPVHLDPGGEGDMAPTMLCSSQKSHWISPGPKLDLLH